MRSKAKFHHHESLINKIWRELERATQEIRQAERQVQVIEKTLSDRLADAGGDEQLNPAIRYEYARRRKAARQRLKRAQQRRHGCLKRLRALRDSLGFH